MVASSRIISLSFSHLCASIALALLVGGCVGTRVEYFTEETYPVREPQESVEWLSAPPIEQYLALARITVTSANAGDETLRASLLDRARSIGADAIIVERPMVTVSQAPTPYYEQGILGPKGAAFGLYGYGWYTPYSSNPYILVQGAVDQPRMDRYVSVIAIKYDRRRDGPGRQ